MNTRRILAIICAAAMVVTPTQGVFAEASSDEEMTAAEVKEEISVGDPDEDEDEKEATVIARRLFADDKLIFEFKSNGTLSIMGNGSKKGDIPDYDSEDAPYSDFAPQCKEIIINDGVVKVGNSAFAGFTETESLDFTDSDLEGIGDHAFEGCSALEEVWFDSVSSYGLDFGSHCFAGCSKLSSMENFSSIPLNSLGYQSFVSCSALEKIDLTGFSSAYPVISEGCFMDCDSLKTVIIPANLYRIGYDAFKSCDNLVEVRRATDPENTTVLPDELITIGEYAFYNCDSLTEVNLLGKDDSCVIEKYAFSRCDNLKDLGIGDGVVIIGENAFANCPELYDIGFLGTGDNLRDIRDRAFYNCTSITKVDDTTILSPTNVYFTIGEEAFAGCIGITDVKIPDTAKSIGEGAFMDCTSLDTLVLGTKLQEIPDYAFKGCSKLGYSTDRNLNGVTIGNSITSIGKEAFAFCSSLKKAGIDSGVVHFIGEGAFRECSSLYSIYTGGMAFDSIAPLAFEDCISLGSDDTFSIGAENIGAQAFKNCSSIGVLELFATSDGVIGKEAFAGCTGLEKLSVNYGIKSLGISSFAGCTNLKTVALHDKADLQIINSGAFEDCNILEKVNLPGTVTVIRADIFKGSGVTDISFGGTAVEFATAASKTTDEYKTDEGIEVLCTGDAGVGKCGENVTYELASNTLTISGKGDMYDYAPGGAPWAGEIISDLVISPATGEKIGIGDNAFYGLGLTNPSLDLPHTGISRLGDGCFAHCTSLGGVKLPADVTDVGDGCFEDCALMYYPDFTGVTVIGDRMFKGDTYATVSFGDSVISIGDYAFEAVNAGPMTFTNVKHIGEGAFKDSQLSGNITLPEAITEIEDFTFMNCDHITKISAPGAKYIGNGAFSGCTALTLADNLNKVKTVGDRAFYNDNSTSFTGITLPEDASIGEEAFSNCLSLTSVMSSQAVNNPDPFVGKRAFNNCSKLMSVDLSKKKTIDDEAFKSKISLTSVDLSKVEYIGDSAFEGCITLTDVGSLSQVKEIGHKAFSGCTAIAGGADGLSLDSITDIGSEAFNVCGSFTSVKLGSKLDRLGDSAFRSSKLQNVTFLGGVNEMGEDVFAECKELKGADLSKTGLTLLPVNTFSECKKLTQVKLPESLEGIGMSAFYEDVLLSEIDIPAGVTHIDFSAFYRCSALAAVTGCKGLKTIDGNAFSSCNALASFAWGEALEEIGARAFESCGLLKTLDAPALTDIDNFAFLSSGIKTIKLPATIVHIGGNAFNYVSPESITYAGTMNEYDDVEIEDIKITNRAFVDFVPITCSDGIRGEIRMDLDNSQRGVWLFDPEKETLTIKAFGDIYTYASADKVPWYDYRNKIKNVEIMDFEGKSIGFLGTNLFREYTALENLIIDKYAFRNASFGSYNFYGCSSLKSIGSEFGLYNLPGSNTQLNYLPYGQATPYIKSIGSNTFEGCSSLQNLVISNEVSTIGTKAFTGPGLTIYTWQGSAAEGFAGTNGIDCVIFDTDPAISALDKGDLTIDLSTDGTAHLDAAQPLVDSMKEEAAFNNATGVAVTELEPGYAIDFNYDTSTSTGDDDIIVFMNKDNSAEISVLAGSDLYSANRICNLKDEAKKNLAMAGKAYYSKVTVNFPASVPSSCKVDFYAGDGSGEMEDQNVQAGDMYKLPPCDLYPPEGMEFDKWNLGEPGDYIKITKDTTLQAVWKKHEHTLISVAKKPATCLQKGNEAYWFCTYCGKIFADKDGSEETTKDALVIPRDYNAHVWGAYYIVKEPTDDTPGERRRICKICGTESSGDENVIPVLGHVHTPERHKAVAADCSHTGNKEYYVCTDSGCGYYFEDKDCTVEIVDRNSVILPEDPDVHKLTDNYHFPAVEALCENDGSMEYWECEDCHRYFADDQGKTELASGEWVIHAVGHKIDVTVSANAPKCTEDGSIEHYKCSVCGQVFLTNDPSSKITDLAEIRVEATGHDMFKVSANEATCTHTGMREHWECKRCGGLFEDESDTDETPEANFEIEMKSHNFEHLEGKAATCTEDGKLDVYRCLDCGKCYGLSDGSEYLGDDYDKLNLTVAATGHDWVTAYKRAATEYEDGVEALYCRNCGETQEKVLPKGSGASEDDGHEHNWSQWFTLKPATEDEEGMRVRVCLLCGKEEKEAIPKKGSVSGDEIPGSRISGEKITLSVKDKDGKDITLLVTYTNSVPYVGKKHVDTGTAASKTAVNDIEIRIEALGSDVLKNAVVKYKFKNNKNATKSGKDTCFSISLKGSTNAKSEEKKLLKLISKELKGKTFKFTVERADITKATNPEVKGSTGKPKALTVTIDGYTLTLKKKDFTYSEGVFTGRGNFTGTLKVGIGDGS